MSDFRRHKKEKHFTQIDNCVFLDHSLSMKAKGLLTQIYSLPDDWNYSVRGLATLFHDGNEAVKNALNELVEHGYIVRTQKTDKLGRFEGYEYDIYETPQNEVSGFPFTDNPSTDNPSTDNSAQLISNIDNTNRVNTKRIDNTPIIPKEVAELDSMFEQFWKAYPRKVDPKGCKRKFIKIKNLKQIFPDIMSALESQKRSKQWNEENGKFIPHPSTWINQERWNLVNEVEGLQMSIEDAVSDDIDGFTL